MVEDVLVGNSLSPEMISSGKNLIHILDEDIFDIHSALWFYASENISWILLLGIPGLNINGPKKAYETLFPILKNNPILNLTLLNIKLVDNSDGFFSLLRNAIKTDKGIEGIRLTRNIINGFFIEDVYIYRLS